MFKWVIGCAGLVLSSVVCADSWSEPQQIKQFPFQLTVDARHKVSIKAEGGKIKAVLANGQQQVLTDQPDAEVLDFNPHVAVQGDFNFDGLNDVAIFEASGYGGVNLFYQLFLADKSGKFVPFQPSISNPSLSRANGLLRSAQRSGPRWYESDFRFHNGKLSARTEFAMIDGELWHAEFFNAAGKRTGAAVTADIDKAKPGMAPLKLKILPEKASLYNQPDENSKTRMYVIRNDTVEILDYKQDDSWTDWFLMRFRGQRVIEKWIKGEAVLKE